MPREIGFKFIRFKIPDFECTVFAGADEESGVGGPGEAVDCADVASEGCYESRYVQKMVSSVYIPA